MNELQACCFDFEQLHHPLSYRQFRYLYPNRNEIKTEVYHNWNSLPTSNYSAVIPIWSVFHRNLILNFDTVF
jgi:hypothetical protein